VEFQTDEEGGVVGLRLGEFSLILHSDQEVQPEYLPPSGQRGRGVIRHFEVENADLYHDTLKEKGVAISKGPEAQSFGLRTMYVYDPDGYNLCFVQRLPRGEGLGERAQLRSNYSWTGSSRAELASQSRSRGGERWQSTRECST